MTLPKPLRVLLVEDRPEDAELLLREMKLGGLSVASRRVESSAEFEDALESFAPDLILSDYTLARGVPTRPSSSSPARSVRSAPSRRCGRARWTMS
jgi:CheY-like chemotaxis protein